jgi:hypothetical protein
MNPSAEVRIAQLESKVESLREAVRVLAGELSRACASCALTLLPLLMPADVVAEDLATLAESTKDRLVAVEARMEDMSQLQAAQGRVVRRQEERLKKALAIVAGALSTTET